MHDHHIKEMAKALVDAGVIWEDSVEQAEAALSSVWQDKIAAVWGTNDVIEQAKNSGVQINEEEARDILQTVLHKHDASIGINWDVLDVHITQR